MLLAVREFFVASGSLELLIRSRWCRLTTRGNYSCRRIGASRFRQPWLLRNSIKTGDPRGKLRVSTSKIEWDKFLGLAHNYSPND